MVQIVKGDNYYIPIKITKNSTVLTPSNVSDVRIQIGDLLKTYSKSEIIFDTTTNEWKYLLTQKQTFAFTGRDVSIQVGVKDGTDIEYSAPVSAYVEESIINAEW